MKSKTRLTPVSWTGVTLDGGFWGRRQRINREATLPTAYGKLKESGTFRAYQWEWDPARPPPPWRIWVGDLGKWIEAASYSLAGHPDAALAERVEEAVGEILKGQKPDGYLYSNPMPPDARWANLQELHQLYDAGHTIEGAVAHCEVTGRRHFVDAMCRWADLAVATFGTAPGQLRGYDGHPEIELALVKLYRATGQRRYLDLARFFVDERGRPPSYFTAERAALPRPDVHRFGWFAKEDFTNCQAHRPVREQKDAVGHAVRALYLYSGMADVAVETGDATLLTACRRLWRSVTRRRMYVTGGIGSSAHGEAFTFDYDLPNETAYAETCASIALVFFAHRLLQIEADAEYADVMERALYNGVMSGVSLDGRRFFYGNRLEVYPRATAGAPENVADRRREWFGCCCCPPNLARLVASIGGYHGSTAPGALYVHLYSAGTVRTQVDGQPLAVRVRTDYPWDGTVRLTVQPGAPRAFALALRIPGWCRRAEMRVNGRRCEPPRQRGYAWLKREWRERDVVDLRLEMPVERVEAHPRVRMDCGAVALQRGPIVYAVEQVDNAPELADLVLPAAARLSAEYRPRLLGGCTVVRGRAWRRAADGWPDALYRAERSKRRPVEFTAVPYSLWGNRRPGEMRVWLRAE
jgi:DUF1680 family protein